MSYRVPIVVLCHASLDIHAIGTRVIMANHTSHSQLNETLCIIMLTTDVPEDPY